MTTAVSVEQAACNALATWLQAGLGADVVVSQRWPDADRPLPGPPDYRGAVTLLLAGEPQVELLQPRKTSDYPIHAAISAKLAATISDTPTACAALELARTSLEDHSASGAAHATPAAIVTTSPLASDLASGVVLANELTAAISPHVTSAAHENPDLRDPLGAVAPVAAGDAAGLVARARLVLATLNAHYAAQIYGWSVEHRTQPVQLDVWAPYEATRDELRAQLEPLLNVDSTAAPAFDADPVRNGCLVALGDGWSGTADFLFDSPRVNQTADAVQQSEFRLTLSGSLDVMVEVKAESPRLALIQLQLTLGTNGGGAAKTATVTPSGVSYSGG